MKLNTLQPRKKNLVDEVFNKLQAGVSADDAFAELLEKMGISALSEEQTEAVQILLRATVRYVRDTNEMLRDFAASQQQATQPSGDTIRKLAGDPDPDAAAMEGEPRGA